MYQKIVELTFLILTIILALPTIHFAVFGLVGLFSYKKIPKAQKQRKYGIIISARDEEKVVANLVESIRSCNYPQQLITVFVVAHNCTDKTAEVARNAGAVVYEYNNSSERTKGFALRYLFNCIERDFGIKSFDGYMVMDSDNIVASDFLEKMNDAFEFYGGKDIITSFRNSKNFGQNVLSGIYGMHFACSCRFESRGRTVCGCSTRVNGTGYVFGSDVVKDGWKYVTLTEDWEFSADQILQGAKIRYCDEAMFYDEQPTSFKIMLRQRLRWAKGHLLVFGTKGADLTRGLVKRSVKNKGSVYDILTQIIPYSIIGVFLGLLQMLLLSPLFGIPFFDGMPFDQFVRQNWLSWVIPTAASYLLGVIQSVLIFILDRKRIKGVSFGKKVLITLGFPLFEMLCVPIQVAALFTKASWKPIPHKESVSHEALNGAVAATVATTSCRKPTKKIRVSKDKAK